MCKPLRKKGKLQLSSLVYIQEESIDFLRTYEQSNKEFCIHNFAAVDNCTTDSDFAVLIEIFYFSAHMHGNIKICLWPASSPLSDEKALGTRRRSLKVGCFSEKQFIHHSPLVARMRPLHSPIPSLFPSYFLRVRILSSFQERNPRLVFVLLVLSLPHVSENWNNDISRCISCRCLYWPGEIINADNFYEQNQFTDSPRHCERTNNGHWCLRRALLRIRWGSWEVDANGVIEFTDSMPPWSCIEWLNSRRSNATARTRKSKSANDATSWSRFSFF